MQLHHQTAAQHRPHLVQHPAPNAAESPSPRAKTAAERRRLQKVIDFQSRRRKGALNDMGFCNKSFLSDRAEGDAKCEAAKPPAGETGGGGTGGSGGCEAGYLLCGTYCCNTAYAFCQGCDGTPICCRIEGACCPSG
jgi:hypothetical protein